MKRKSSKTISLYGFEKQFHKDVKSRAKALFLSVSGYFRKLAREDMEAKP